MKNMIELGKKLVSLGRALQDDSATLTELVSMAHDCGLQLEFRITRPATPEKHNEDDSATTQRP